MDYLAQAARHLSEAEAGFKDGRQEQDGYLSWSRHLELASHWERLAAIEKGLVPPGWQAEPSPAAGEQPRVN